MDNEREKLEQGSTSGFLSKSLKSYTEFEEKWAEALAKFLTRSFGTLRFLNLTLLFFLFWIIINLGLVSGIKPFDPQPFGWLVLIVQLFVIVLSIVVLISQNQAARINEIRQQIDLEINVRAEHEITKILQMIEEIHKKIGISRLDKELEQMKKTTNISEIKEDVERVIEKKSKTNGIT